MTNAGRIRSAGRSREPWQLLADLRSTGIRLAALSNWSAEKFPIARERYRFLDWFETVVISGEVGIAKPDPRILRHLLERLGLAAEATVYVDDVPANVAVAAELGMTTVRFRDPDTLRDDLRRLGLAVAPSEGSQATRPVRPPCAR